MKKLYVCYIVLLIILYPNSGYPCKCDLSKIEQFVDHPETAPVVMVGKYVHSKSSGVLKLVKSWTKATRETRLGGGTDCSYSGLKNGVNYLLLAEGSNEGEGADLVSECDSALLELSADNISLIHKLSKKKDFIGEINPSWQFCESDNECVNSKNQCGKHIGVNKKYKKDYLDFLKSKSMKTDCSKEKSSDAEKFSNSKCVENFCS